MRGRFGRGDSGVIMDGRTVLRLYVAMLVVFLTVDLLWLGVVSGDWYAERLQGLMRAQVNWPAAVLFYLLYVAGILFFAVMPAVRRRSRARAALGGGFFGLVTYATFDLTNLALIEGWPTSVAVVDILWGTLLCAFVSLSGFAFHRRLG